MHVRKQLNCTAHADVEQSDVRKLSANQTMIEHTPHAIQLYIYRSVHKTGRDVELLCADAELIRLDVR